MNLHSLVAAWGLSLTLLACREDFVMGTAPLDASASQGPSQETGGGKTGGAAQGGHAGAASRNGTGPSAAGSGSPFGRGGSFSGSGSSANGGVAIGGTAGRSAGGTSTGGSPDAGGAASGGAPIAGTAGRSAGGISSGRGGQAGGGGLVGGFGGAAGGNQAGGSAGQAMCKNGFDQQYYPCCPYQPPDCTNPENRLTYDRGCTFDCEHTEEQIPWGGCYYYDMSDPNHLVSMCVCHCTQQEGTWTTSCGC